MSVKYQVVDFAAHELHPLMNHQGVDFGAQELHPLLPNSMKLEDSPQISA